MIMAGRKGGVSGAGKPRSAITGQYVTEEYAAKHPRTTVVERPTKRK